MDRILDVAFKKKNRLIYFVYFLPPFFTTETGETKKTTRMRKLMLFSINEGGMVIYNDVIALKWLHTFVIAETYKNFCIPLGIKQNKADQSIASFRKQKHHLIQG